MEKNEWPKGWDLEKHKNFKKPKVLFEKKRYKAFKKF